MLQIDNKILKTTKRLQYAYITAISLIALALIISQFVVQSFLNSQQDDAKVINVSGRQRMLSQKITKEVFFYLDTFEEKEKQQLLKTFQLFEESHLNLTLESQTSLFSEDYTLSPQISSLYDSLNPFFNQIKESVTTLSSYNKETPSDLIQAEKEKLFGSEKLFLPLMNKIVLTYEQEAKNKLEQIKKAEYIIVLFSLFILLIEAIFIFRPVVAKTKLAIQSALNSNKQLAEKNGKLLAVEEELRQNIEELQTIQEKLELQKIEVENSYKELQSTQKQLIQSEKMASLGQLVASIAHEINTPLGAIQSSSTSIETVLSETLPNLPYFIEKLGTKMFNLFNNFLEKTNKKTILLSSKEKRVIKYSLIEKIEILGLPKPEYYADLIVEMNIYKEEELLKKLFESDYPITTKQEIIEMLFQISSIKGSNQNIQSAIKRASKTVFALKTYAHQDHTEQKSLVDITKTIETTLILYNNQIRQGIELKTNFDTVPSFLGYSDELIQVWTNLIHNAIQAMKGEGTLIISSQNQQINQEKSVLISIQDTGKGIPKEYQDKIFDAFFTTKRAGEGSGLGLDITKKIIVKHNGKIWFESEEHIGTTFFVEIPVQN